MIDLNIPSNFGVLCEHCIQQLKDQIVFQRLTLCCKSTKPCNLETIALGLGLGRQWHHAHVQWLHFSKSHDLKY